MYIELELELLVVVEVSSRLKRKYCWFTQITLHHTNGLISLYSVYCNEYQSYLIQQHLLYIIVLSITLSTLEMATVQML